MSNDLEAVLALVERWRGQADVALRRSGTWNGNDIADRIEFMADELEALLPALREAVRDSERLDWLADRDNPIGNVQLPSACVKANLHSLRAAIDAAMKMEASHDEG